MSPFNTHIPILEYVLEHYNEFVIECGGGLFSTPLIIKKSKKSITFENNYDWFQKLLIFKDDNHNIYHDENYLEAVKFQWKHNKPELRYSFAFIDGDNWNERCELVEYLSDKCDVIILHDSFPQHLERCVSHLGKSFKFAYSHNFYPFSNEFIGMPEYPPTLCLSNYVDFNNWRIK